MARIRFLHIPKTGGSSFDECMFLEYLKAHVLRQRFTFTGHLADDRTRYEALPQWRKNHLEMVTGHAPLTTGIDAIDGLPTITLLRDPVERVKSQCQHISEGKNLPGKVGFKNPAMDLDAFLDRPRPSVRNAQAKTLLGVENYKLPELSDEDKVERVLHVLEHRLTAFGLTEEFDRSLLLFKYALAWPRFPIYRWRNKRNPKALLKFEERHLEKIRALNRIDIAVYERAQRLFWRRCEQVAEALSSDLVGLRTQLARANPIFMGIDLARGIRRPWLAKSHNRL